MMTLLILAVLVLGVLAVLRLSSVYELTSKLRGKREEDITERDNKMNARLLWAFPFAYFGFFLWLTLAYKPYMLPVSASEHGVWLDNLMNFNWVILIVVFFITNILLFYFAGKYYWRHDRKAYYYPHNNKWELAWTIVPAFVMIGIIIYGLKVWNKIVEPAVAGTAKVELYAQQFSWTVRYPGADGELGATDFRLINETNPLGIVTEESIAKRLEELETEIAASEKKLTADHAILGEIRLGELQDHIAHEQRTAQRVINLRTLMRQEIKDKHAKGGTSAYDFGADDIVVKEFHLPVQQNVELVIRSKDIIHSVYLPHHRAQMNAVPGMATRINLKPTISSDSMRTYVMKDPKFEFILLCNKICGASHYNMQMPLIVESEGAYETWLKQQKGFQTAEVKKEEVPATPAAPVDTTATANTTAQAMPATNEPVKK